MTFVIQSLETCQFEVSKTPKHRKEPLWVSFLMPDRVVGFHQCLAEVITLVELYREDIMDIRLSIDCEYLTAQK